jgi:uncharacterized protein (DUF1697 family)
MRQISILRGINVGGRNKINMQLLADLYRRLDLQNVTTYIQSGNVAFDSDADSNDLTAQIEAAIQTEFGFTVPVIVRSRDNWASVVASNPFLEKITETDKLHVTFLEKTPDPQHLNKLLSYHYPPDEFIVIDNNIYLHCPIDYGNSKLTNNFFESKLKIKATTRNWRTTCKLLEL